MGLVPTRESVIGQFINGRNAAFDFLQLATNHGGTVFGWIDSDGHLQGSLKEGLGSITPRLDQVLDPTANKTFNLGSNNLFIEGSGTSEILLIEFGTGGIGLQDIGGGGINIGSANGIVMNSLGVNGTSITDSGVGGIAVTIGTFVAPTPGAITITNSQSGGITIADTGGFIALTSASTILLDNTGGGGIGIVDSGGFGIFLTASNGANRINITNSGTGGTSITDSGGGGIAISSTGSLALTAFAGVANPILLPATTGTSGQVLTTNGANPQQTSWTTPFGTIGGSIASTQVAVGSGANTISGSANLTFASSILTVNGQVTVTSATTGVAHPTTAGIIFDPLSAFPAYMTHDGTTGSFTLRMDNQVTNAHGLLSWGAAGLFVDGGSNSPSFNIYTGAPQPGYVGITNQSAQFDLNGAGLFAVTANPGAGAKGEILLNPFTDTITFYGNVSGNAAIGTSTAAGTPNKINLPTTTGTSGQVLTTDGANPQQTSWTTVGTTTTIASGSQALGTTLITSGSKSTILTITAAGVLATDNVMLDFNTDPSGITGYAPSANGMLTIIKWCSAGAINIYQYNNTAASITPGAVTVSYRVVR